NSYYYKKLDFPLCKADDFSFSFELQLDSIAGGVAPGKQCGFEIAVGLLNIGQAGGSGFRRGSGVQSPNVVAFDYLLAPVACPFGATKGNTIVSTNNQFRYGHTFPFELRAGVTWAITMTYASSNQTLITTISEDGAPPIRLKDTLLGPNFTDFAVDA